MARGKRKQTVEGDVVYFPGGTSNGFLSLLELIFPRIIVHKEKSILIDKPVDDPEEWRNVIDVFGGKVPTYDSRMPPDGIFKLIALGVTNFHIGNPQWGFHFWVKGERIVVAHLWAPGFYEILTIKEKDIPFSFNKSGSALRQLFRNKKTVERRVPYSGRRGRTRGAYPSTLAYVRVQMGMPDQ